jgi:hypothetical protein
MKNYFFSLVVLIVAFSGCNNNQNDEEVSIPTEKYSSGNSEITEESPRKTGSSVTSRDNIIIEQTGNNKKAYTNSTAGFSFEFPSDLSCKKGNLSAFYTEENWNGIVNEETDHIYLPEFTIEFSAENSLDEFILDSINPKYKDSFISKKDQIKKLKAIGENEIIQVSNFNFESNGCKYFLQNDQGVLRLATIYNCNENEMIDEVLNSINMNNNSN